MKDGENINILSKTNCKKELGVHIDSELRFNEHIKNQVKRARRTAGVINSTILNKTQNIMLPLFKSMVRPIIEYANSVWSPYLVQDIKNIENIQRTFTKKIYGMNNKNYHQRLISLNLPSLEFRRLRGDLIEVYKIIHNIYDPATTKKLFTMVSDHSSTRKSNNLNLFKRRTNNNVWNDLPGDVVHAKNVNLFKNKIDSYFRTYKYSTELYKARGLNYGRNL